MKSNPFSTRFVAPGKIGWVRLSGPTIAEIAHSFYSDHSARAAIVGPHGSGKSTLLEHLIPKIGTVFPKLDTTFTANFPNSQCSDTHPTTNSNFRHFIPGVDNVARKQRSVIRLNLRGTASSRLAVRSIWRWCGRQTVLVLDGYEQLSYFDRMLTVLNSYRRGCGLLVTAHHPTCLPTLFETKVTPALADKIMGEILDKKHLRPTSFLNRRELNRLLELHQGNFREVLMTCYDDYEKRQKHAVGNDWNYSECSAGR